jgi:predicted nucleic acid-binding Zn ribbon protein
MKRLISQSAFHLKGSGWYVTDYARKSKPDTSGGKAEPSAKKAEAKDTTSSAVDKKD